MLGFALHSEKPNSTPFDRDINSLPSSTEETAPLALLPTSFFIVGNLKQAGTAFAWARLASNPYPKVFFVSTSV